jgi:hypothetical protein
MTGPVAHAHALAHARAQNVDRLRWHRMTLPAFPLRAGVRRPTYARSRLLLGITGVGTAVLVAIVALLSDVAQSVLSTSTDQPPHLALASLALVFAGSQVACMLFDLIGGAWLVRRREWPSVWLARWARGAAVQWGVWMLGATTLLVTARLTMGHVTTTQSLLVSIAVFVVLQLILGALRGSLARVVSALPTQYLSEPARQATERAGLDPRHVLVVDTPDEGFVGGYAGLQAGTLIVPLRWTQLPTRAFVAALVRRRIIGASGAHRRGVLAAMAWNTIGFAIVLALTEASLATAAGVVTMAFGMTLWAFAGVLLLPTLSRHAVFAVDRTAAQQIGVADVTSAIELLDRWQDDEAARSPLVETIFHPVPSRTARLQRLSSAGNAGVRWYHMHHVARHALWLSWASFTPLSRLVHCNVGRTALWVMLPGD